MNRAQVMITFDDGTVDHSVAARELWERDLHGVFGIVTDRIANVGFLSRSQLKEMANDGHFICNHTAAHKWLGNGPDKPGLSKNEADAITEDCLKGKEALNALDHHGDYLLMPFGTGNVNGDQHLELLCSHFKWIRLTIGAPLPPVHGLWTPAGGKRLYPSGYSGPIVGLTEAADVRRPNGVRTAVDNAIASGSLAIVMYHSVSHVVGETQMVTWDRFCSDIDYIADQVAEGRIDCVVPTDLVK